MRGKSRRFRKVLASVVAAAAVVVFSVAGGVGLAQTAIAVAQYQYGHGGQYQYGKKVTICHKGKNTISISVNAWPAHLRHGDTEGACATTTSLTAAQRKAKKAKQKKAAASVTTAQSKAKAAKKKATKSRATGTAQTTEQTSSTAKKSTKKKSTEKNPGGAKPAAKGKPSPPTSRASKGPKQKAARAEAAEAAEAGLCAVVLVRGGRRRLPPRSCRRQGGRQRERQELTSDPGCPQRTAANHCSPLDEVVLACPAAPSRSSVIWPTVRSCSGFPEPEAAPSFVDGPDCRSIGERRLRIASRGTGGGRAGTHAGRITGPR